MTAPVSAPPRRRRAVLYTPGDRADRIEKALLSGTADTVVADLEDAVPPSGKEAARAATRKALESAAATARAERGVRINAWPGPLAEADLAAVLPARPQLVAVPKVEDPAALRSLDARLARGEAELGLPAGSVQVLAILETARGVVRAADLAAGPRVAAVAFGAEDLAADAGLRRTASNAEVAMARQWVALCAAAAGVQALDMVTVDLRDLERCALEAAEARALGYTGKMCIHPTQAVAVHEAMRPTRDEEAWARKVMDAVQGAGIASGGVAVVDGKMVDVPVIRQAQRVLADLA